MSEEAAPPDESPVPARPVRICPGADGGWLTARIEDIARGRVRLLLDRPLALAQPVTVELSAGSAVPACVIGVEARAENDWLLTCVFTRELTDEELLPFGARRLRPAAADIRRWVRFPCETRAFYQVIGATPPCQGMAQVLNISAGGVGLCLNQPLEIGKLVGLEIQGPQGQRPMPVLACVVYSTAHAEGEWAVGCTFIGELAEADLRGLT